MPGEPGKPNIKAEAGTRGSVFSCRQEMPVLHWQKWYHVFHTWYQQNHIPELWFVLTEDPVK